MGMEMKLNQEDKKIIGVNPIKKAESPTESFQRQFLEERQQEADRTGLNPERLYKNEKGFWSVHGTNLTTDEFIESVNRRHSQENNQ